MDSLIVHPVYEFYTDGKVFATKAREFTDQFKKWRYLRIAVVMSFASLEAAVNLFFIRETVLNQGLESALFPGRQLGKKPFVERTDISITKKWKAAIELQAKDSVDKTLMWRSFGDFKELRRNIVHFHGRVDKAYFEVGSKIDDCLDTTRSLLVVLYGENEISKWDKLGDKREAA